MKRFSALVAVLLVMLGGCSGKNEALDSTMTLRAKLLGSGGCRFRANITADYSDKVHTFTMDCQSDLKGNLSFTVSAPESISGIQGSISGEGGKLCFEEQVLAFPLLADEQLSPVSAPWIFMRTLQGGIVKYCVVDRGLTCATIDDSYGKEDLRLEVWLGEEELPVRGEILYRERRILTLEIEDFQIL